MAIANAAEIEELGRRLWVYAIASMEPLRERSGDDRPGKGMLGGPNASMEPLRERSGDRIQPRLTTASLGLQWSRCANAAEILRSALVQPTLTDASMEPLRERSGDRYSRAVTRFQFSCFNGAAARTQRRCGVGRGNGELLDVASMEPLRERSGDPLTAIFQLWKSRALPSSSLPSPCAKQASSWR